MGLYGDGAPAPAPSPNAMVDHGPGLSRMKPCTDGGAHIRLWNTMFQRRGMRKGGLGRIV